MARSLSYKELGDVGRALKCLNDALSNRRFGKLTVSSVVLVHVDEDSGTYYDIAATLYDDGFNVRLETEGD